MTTERGPGNSDIGTFLVLRNDKGALFRGVVLSIAGSGAYQMTEAVNLGEAWEPIWPAELRLVRGAMVMPETVAVVG